nr:DivIVA domain-containing protein [Bifidobacterium mongoliense]
MPLLTPNDVRDQEFSTHRFREGYDMDEVDDYLDHVRDTINRLTKTLKTLQKETKK